ncbi:uracil-DNA glycosylase [Clostridia bacterium]|nr:uracil-DNA glycosylase [Clostridia bacterium]
MAVQFNNDWDEVIGGEFEKPYYLALREFLKAEYGTYTVYPPMNDIFNAFRATPYADVKAVILGQDPYHNPGQAHGMCFSVRKGVPPPPSLLNIYKEIDAEFPGAAKCDPADGCLEDWARQGVLLLNTVLTVRANAPMSHRGQGWERFTDAVIQKLNEREKPVVFLLWGSPARAKAGLITGERHFILQAAHPSPLSAMSGFFHCGHFKRANQIIAEHALGEPVDWLKRG